MRWRIRGCPVTFALGLVVALLAGDTHGAERGHPFRIGALSQSWGPTPDVVGLRDGGAGAHPGTAGGASGTSTIREQRFPGS
jgi:hypothetical protein